jgi:hypothetical protein
VDRRAAGTGGDAGLAQHGHRLTFLQGALERAQLGVDLRERVQLGEDQRVVACSEAMQVEDETAEIAVGQLARLAQKARTPTCPSS